MITAYSWAAGIFEQTLHPSLTDAEKRAKLVYEINTPLVKGKNGSSTDVLLKDLDTDDKNNRLNKIAQISMAYLTEQMDVYIYGCLYEYLVTSMDWLYGCGQSNPF